jgi:hypothetical protein
LRFACADTGLRLALLKILNPGALRALSKVTDSGLRIP